MISPRIEWAKCPECDVTINDFTKYSLAVLNTQSMFYLKMKCPCCKKEFLIKAEHSLKFNTEKLKEAERG